MTVLPEIKMVNEMSKTVLRAGQKGMALSSHLRVS
jgi:hypothetical protein